MEQQIQAARSSGVWDGACASIIAAIVLVGACLATRACTIQNVQREAVANGCGFWTIVNGETEFAWGMPK